MCDFITAWMNPRGDTPAFREVVDAHELAFRRATAEYARFFREARRSNEVVYLATGGHCDCGTGLLPAATTGPSPARVAKMRKKGWSEARIVEWRASLGGPAPAQVRDRERWWAFLQEALALPDVHQLTLLVHEDPYQGITLKPGTRVSVADVADLPRLTHAVPVSFSA